MLVSFGIEEGAIDMSQKAFFSEGNMWTL
uniref:Uncharacterized protein n=1 Tax=Arundo donax TaxID=35708 RepID=A0A0A9CG59_ARUDO